MAFCIKTSNEEGNLRVTTAIYSYTTQYIPKPIHDQLLFMWTKSRLRRWLNKRNLKLLRRKKAAAIVKYGTFDSAELIQVLKQHGIQEGDVLFYQGSFNDLYTFAGSAKDLIDVLVKTVGSTGTLLMPAYTDISNLKEPYLFDPTHEPTYTGMVNEIFRRIPGVTRSLHPRHSICGTGPLAKQLLIDHEKCTRADGVDSPFDKIRQLPNAHILTLGLPPGYLSFLHWIEDFEPEKLPFSIHNTKPVLCSVLLPDGSTCKVTDYLVKPTVAARLSYFSICKHLSVDSWKFTEYKGVKLGLYKVVPLANDLLAMRNLGIIHYRKWK